MATLSTSGTTLEVGGGDMAMDACRVAKHLPGCKRVKVIYRRGLGEIPARAIELHHAVKEDVEFRYHTQQVAVVPRGSQLALQCVKTALGEPDEDGRRRPVVNILRANAGEASMMARCAGKTRLYNIEPEDLRSATRATAAATGVPLAGTRAA